MMASLFAPFTHVAMPRAPTLGDGIELPLALQLSEPRQRSKPLHIFAIELGVRFFA